ncbi:hypothetical protein ACFW7J_33790 [Streptomyces sp. NPDC059525]|uniref:hypothetical protein n=1 Tax=Streptomyces sp. NPDC059525 TaxID=3346857 RepID=UPI00369C78D2
MSGWLLRRFGAARVWCVTAVGGRVRRLVPWGLFVVVIVLAVLAVWVLALCGVAVTVGIQVVAAVLAAVEAVRRLTVKSGRVVLVPGVVRP